MYHTHTEKNTLHHKTNHCHMTKSLMINQITYLRNKTREKEIIKNLKKKIEDDQRSTPLDDGLHQDLLTIMQIHNEIILTTYTADSFQRIFWTNQYEAASQKSSRHFRWHPAIIKWCIFLRHKSSKAYELLRKTGILQLPSQRTLRDYTYTYKSSVGFSTELDNQLINDSNLSTLENFQKYICLLGDEMYIKEGLVYNKHTGELAGYCDLGEINNHLICLEQEYQGMNHTTTKQLASTMMVLMVRSLLTSFTFPYASFAASHLTGEQLVPVFYEAIMRLERCGFKVTCITLDGNSVNRKFFKLIGSNEDTSIVYKFRNPLSDKSREVYLFSDPPHLIKTARNCLANSKRNMEVI